MLILILLVSLFYQTVKEPEYAGIFYALSTGAMTDLERRSPQIKVKSNIFTSSAKGYYEINNGKSSVRYKAGETATFLVSVPTRKVDPMASIQLLHFESRKDTRRITVSRASAGIINPGASVVPLRSIGFDVEKYGEHSFKIILNRGLPPGEYCFRSVVSTDLFCFGFDKPTN